MLSLFDLRSHMTLMASGTGDIEFFLAAQAEGILTLTDYNRNDIALEIRTLHTRYIICIKIKYY